jgi:hypothetical protein
MYRAASMDPMVSINPVEAGNLHFDGHEQTPRWILVP